MQLVLILVLVLVLILVLVLVLILVLVPPAATLAEAVSPHTWDSATVTLAAGLTTVLIERLPW